MIRFARRFAAVFLASLAIALPARATTFSVDFTDIWWNANEDGWGVTVSQQGDTIFATFFIYGPDKSARWYSAAIFPVAGPASVVSFTGDMYLSSGSYFGDPTFTKTPATKVGTATMAFNSATTGTLTYTIGGVAVTKQIVRQTFAGNSLAGTYFGGVTSDRTSCSNSAQNGQFDITGVLLVTQTGSSVYMETDFPDGNGGTGACAYRGNYTPQGRVGTISSGTWSCVVGNSTVVQGVSFSMTNIDGQLNGFHATFVASDQAGCVYNGRFGGIRFP